MTPDLRAFAFSFFSYRPRVSPAAWAEAELHLSPLITETPGPFSLRLHPYGREILDTFADNSVSDCALCFAAQCSKTTLLSAGALYRIGNDPGPTLFVQPSQESVESFAETRFRPLFESSAQLRALKPKERDRMKRAEWRLLNANVNFVGAGSPSALASRPIATLILDEVDKYPESTAKEAGAVDLAIERTAAFHSARRFYTSTPTTESAQIWQLFLKGDQRYYHVPCPHCRELIRLEWGQVTWDQEAKDAKTEEWDYKRVKKSAFYKCQKCGGTITDGHKTKAMRAGVWVPSNPDSMPGWRSYHLNRLYSPTVTFGAMAVAWLAAKTEGLSALQSFINSALAEPWVDRAISIKEEQLKPLLGTNERGTYDATDGGVNLMAIDVQTAFLVWVVRRFYTGNRSCLVDWGMAPLWTDAEEVFNRYSCRFAAVDTGFRTSEVYDQIAQRGGAWVGMKGGCMQQILRVVYVDPYTGGKQAGRQKICLIHLNDEEFTNELFARLDGKTPGWQLTKEIDINYAKQILAVYKSEKKKRNGKTETTIRDRGVHDYFDGEKMLIALASILKLGRAEKTGEPQTEAPSGPRVVGSFA